MINIQGLKEELVAKVAALDDTVSAEDILLLSSLINDTTTDRIVAVDTVNDLPLLLDGDEVLYSDGSMFFVNSIGVLVISNNSKWIGFDGRVLRSDVLLSSVAYAWGSNNSAQLGDGTTTNRSSPVSAAGGITNWSQVDAGSSHSLGVTADGIAYGWGNNYFAQLGDGTTTNRSSPVSVVGGITGWSQVSAGSIHSLGLTADGIAYGWGRNYYGQLGDGTTIARSSPVSVVGGITNWTQVSGGGQHSLGLTADGIIYAWGYNAYGQLGDGTTPDYSANPSPVSVVGGITNWSQVSGGGNHSLGLTADGIAYAWGDNNNGRLGDGTTIGRSSPVSVVGGITNWSQVSAGYTHSLGLTADSIAYAWGSNISGQLGDGTTIARSSPVSVIGGITNWSQVSGGGGHSLGLTADGIAYAWGSNNQGRLGDGTTTDRSSPVTVVGGITNWSQVSGGGHSLALNLEETG